MFSFTTRHNLAINRQMRQKAYEVAVAPNGAQQSDSFCDAAAKGGCAHARIAMHTEVAITTLDSKC
jgi:hypothetical protein